MAETVLFVSYDGVLGGPGRSQVLPYLLGYAAAGWRPVLLSYEKPDLLGDAPRREAVSGALEGAGIRWSVLPFRRAMARDLVAGLRAVRRLVEEERPAVLHARSYVPALLCDLAGRRHGAALLFDMRGFWPDERVDGGLWSRRHPLYLLWKRLERRLLRRAQGVAVLSLAGARVLREEGLVPERTPLEVVPCAADLDLFRPLPESEAAPALRPFLGKRVYSFLGSTGTWYLREEMLDFAAEAVREDPEARLLFLTEDPAGPVLEGLAARAVPADRFLVARASHAEVPRWIGISRAGVFFIRSCRSKKASCPTKLAEFLACGVPVVINDGIGDTADIVREARVGVVVDGFDGASGRRAREAVEALHAGPDLRGDCRREAECRFDVRSGSRTFLRLAARLASS